MLILAALTYAPDDSATIINIYKDAGVIPEFPFITKSDGGGSLAQLFTAPTAGGTTWMMHPDREYDRINSYYEEPLTSTINDALADDCDSDVTERFTLTVTQGTGSGDYNEGVAVTVTANSPQPGYVFSIWTGDTMYLSSTTSASATVTMPAKDISLAATFIKEAIDTINPSPNLLTWCNWGVMVDSDGSSCDTGSALIDNNVASVRFTIAASDSTTGKWCWGSLGSYLPEDPINNLREVNWIKVVYKSDADFALTLPQAPLDVTGESFMDTVPSTGGVLDTLLLKVSEFTKPDWSSDNTALDLSIVTALSFEMLSPYSGGTGEIEVQDVVLYNYQGETNATSISMGSNNIKSTGSVFMMNGELHLNIPEVQAGNVEIVSLTGRRVAMIDNIKASATANTLMMPLQVARGIYLVRIFDGNQFLTRRILVD